MMNNKVCTGKQATGKYGRFWVWMLLGFIGVNSCSLLDQPTTEDIINNITGTWKCQEISSSFGTQNYEVVVSKSSEMSVHILNFFLDGMEIYAEVEGYSITIPVQTIGDYQISGSGTIQSNYNQIDWNYSIADASGIDNFTATYTLK